MPMTDPAQALSWFADHALDIALGAVGAGAVVAIIILAASILWVQLKVFTGWGSANGMDTDQVNRWLDKKWRD